MIQDLDSTPKASLRYLSIDKVLILLYALYTFRGAWLAFDHGGYMPWFEMISVMMPRLCVPIAILFCYKKRTTELSNMVILILPVFYWALSSFHTYGSTGGGDELALITCALFILLPDDMKRRIFTLFYRLFLVTAVISIFVWICFFLKINIGFQQVAYYSQRENAGFTYYYYRWFIFAIFNELTFYRLCGVFNEPGALGTLCALLFICTHKKSTFLEKVILLVTGVLTFSLAFFILVFMYVAIKVCLKNPRNIIFVGVFIMLFLSIPNIDFHNELLNRTAARFKITDTGLAGNNRTTAAFDYEFKEFIKSSDVWIGRGNGYNVGDRNASWKSYYLMPYGIIGTVGMFGLWLVAALYRCNRSKEELIYILLFFASLYQRPNAIQSIWGYVVLFGGLIWMSSDMSLELT